MRRMIAATVVALLVGGVGGYVLHGQSPLPRNGRCPSRYSRDGNYCIPQRGAKPAMPRNGRCPSGWNRDGNYCVSNK